MALVETRSVAPGIHLMDIGLYSIPRMGAVYLIEAEKPALMEAGDGHTTAAVLEGLGRLGFRPQDISYVVVSHIHLDHAGGAGVLLQQLPQARLVVHERGARHLINPGRLLESHRQWSGSEPGRILPVPGERVQAVRGGGQDSPGARPGPRDSGDTRTLLSLHVHPPRQKPGALRGRCGGHVPGRRRTPVSRGPHA